MSVVVARDQSTASQLIFPWPSPVPWGAEVVCAESEVAILCPNWEVGEKLGPGRHKVSHGNPQAHVLAYFINTNEQVVPFERQISLIERSTGQPVLVRFFGGVRIKVGDPEFMCHQLVGLPYHDLTTGVLRSVELSVSRSFERMMAKLCMAMATVSDMANPGSVAQLVNLVASTHPLAIAVAGLEFIRFEQFGLSVGKGEAVVWQHGAPGKQTRVGGNESIQQEHGVDAPTTLDNIALLDPDEVEDDESTDSGDASVAARTASDVALQSGGPPPPPAPGLHQTGSNPALAVRADPGAPPPPSATTTGSNPAGRVPGVVAGQIPFSPPAPVGGRTATTPPGGMPGAPTPLSVPHGPPPPLAVPVGPPPPASMPGGPPPASVRTASVPPGGIVSGPPGARVQPTMPGGHAPSTGRIQPIAPGGVTAPRQSSPYLNPPMAAAPAPGGQPARRKTPPLGMPMQTAPQSGHSPLPIGSQVLVYWNDGLWHAATIRQFSQGQYQVSIDGSHALTWVQPNQIRRH